MAAPLAVAVAGASLLSALVALGVAVIAYRHRDVPGSTPFGLLMVAAAGWSTATAARLLVADPTVAYAVDVAGRVATAQVAPLGLVFALAYAGQDRWLAPRWLAIVWVVPAAYVTLVLTAPLHGVGAGPESFVRVTQSGVTAWTLRGGAVEWSQDVYAYALILMAYGLLADLFVRSATVHRRQALLVGVGMVVPLAADVAFDAGVALHPGVNLTPAAFVVSAVAVGWGLYRYDFLAVMPLSSDLIADELPDPVIVLDESDRIVDANPAARTLFAEALQTELLPDVLPDLAAALRDGADGFSLDSADGPVRFFDPQVQQITDQHGIERGRLVLLRDVTGQQRRQDRLEALQAATQQLIAARTDEEVAELAVDFAEQALDRYVAAVFLSVEDHDRLDAAAVTEAVAKFYPPDVRQAEPGDAIYDAYATGDSRRIETEDDDAPVERFVAVPMGEQGVFCIGTRDPNRLTPDDEQFAAILARTTQVAIAQVRREQELRRSRSTVKTRTEQLEFFNGVLRHALRNALLVIQGRAEYLADDVPADEREHLDRIVAWCEDLADLTEEVRAVNDTVTATEDERLEAVDLTAVLRETVGEIAERHPDTAVTWDVHEGLRAQANHLAQKAIDEVVRNAVQHNDADDPVVAVSTVLAADRIQVRVADNGPGMSDQLKETVFERDLGTSQTSQGFGLYFVSVLMDLYGGTVWFEDNEPRGTVAVLEFQVADET